MATQGLKPKIRDLVVTELLKSIGTSESHLRVRRAGAKLSFDGYGGDELTIAVSPSVAPACAPQTQTATNE